MTQPTIALPFDLLEAKLRPPQIGRRSVSRTALIERLDETAAPPIVVVCAGPGYGKTTVLTQWADSPGQRPFAWVSVDRHDNDPVTLLTYVAVALDRVSPLDAGVFEALASPGASIEGTVVPRLCAALATMAEPLVLVLDDVHAIDNRQCLDAITALARHVGNGSQLALAARDNPALPLGLLRTRGLISEVGADELRMGEDEARELLEGTGLDVSDSDVAELVRRTEGWPAGLYLAALSAGTTRLGPGDVGGLTGTDPFVADFLQTEFLAHLPPGDLPFLRRTSMLEQLSGPLCDAVLASSGSAEMLASLEHSNRFVVALDRTREWYRCHPLVRELLSAQLVRSEPELVTPLLSRAVDWCAANGQESAAIGYAQAAGDTDRVARLMERTIQPVFQSGRAATVEAWLGWLEAHDGMGRYPAVSVIGAMFYSVIGRPTASDRWADVAELGTHEGSLVDGSASIESWRALLRAFRCRNGVEVMRTDAALAVDGLAPQSTWHPAALVLLGMAELLSGSAETADDHFADVADEAVDLGAPDMLPIALAERAIVAIGRDEWVRAHDLAEHAIFIARRSRREEAALNALVYAVAARIAVHRDRPSSAQELLTKAQRRLPQLTHVLPIPSVQTRLELARTYLVLADQAGARTMLREIEAIRRRRPDLGTLQRQAAQVASTLTTAGRDAPGLSALTAAELHLLPWLTTHLTFREIADRLYLSQHTVKSHVMAVYRKLGVTSRGAAVDRARSVGLL